VSLRDRLLHLLRVPPRPHLPARDPAAVRTFNAAPQYLTYRRISWALKQLGALVGLFVGLFFLREVPDIAEGRIRIGPFVPSSWMIRNAFVFFEGLAWAGFLAQAIGGFLLQRLDWEQRWYLVSDRSLRVREGILRLREKTTTFANIQNVSIRQGPLQRWFGIADVEVKSAGGGGAKKDELSHDDLHTVWLRGVSDAEALRDTILERVRQVGDNVALPPADESTGVDEMPRAAPELGSAAAGPSLAFNAATAESRADPLVDAARELLEESRALNRSLAQPASRPG
jgi:membrane protein YdbS with pleckstrin-like domain